VSQGIPTVPTFVLAEQGDKNLKKLNEAKKSLLKIVEKKFPDVEKLYTVNNSQVMFVFLLHFYKKNPWEILYPEGYTYTMYPDYPLLHRSYPLDI
jgi:hypothetical protein